ncbi:hypothetical protein CTAM01_10811 [Colletotrichum tamarilloi]|uniref:Secreted protein n=1 Tax=Colletotrichum tamarilloi TaxID=1209934 RepID=A0ABQ9QZ78_9PEZI|nr:uncharacterized protein CTAM01_10811 [Colletotrichum tamarilloi]KAK1490142.1 hypothetical protein CTAM01_10811 [Colletotrichum tamarilloi]
MPVHWGCMLVSWILDGPAQASGVSIVSPVTPRFLSGQRSWIPVRRLCRPPMMDFRYCFFHVVFFAFSIFQVVGTRVRTRNIRFNRNSCTGALHRSRFPR